jgi:hypothetical protein
MQARVAILVALWLSAAMIANAAADPYTPPTPDAFLRAIKSYPYAAATARRDRIRAGVPRLVRCMGWTEVRKLMGDPDFGIVAFRGGTGNTVPTRRLWTYILEKPAATEAVQGSRVVLWLGNDFKLQAITIHGAPGLETNISRRNQACPTS